MLLTSARARSRADAGQCSGGFHGQEAGGYGLQDRRSRRRQREVVGGRGPKRRRNGSRFAARPARGRSDENGYEGGEREGRGISHARVAVLQIRSLIAASRISARRSPDSGLAVRENGVTTGIADRGTARHGGRIRRGLPVNGGSPR